MLGRVFVLMLGLVVCTPLAFAEPPPWAPAHGYRDKHDQGHKHRERRHRSIISTDTWRCNRELAGAILGGVVGGVIGSEAGEGHEDRDLATAAGIILGAFIGSRLGRSMDEADRYCTGQVLETTPTGQTVDWVNPDTGTTYHVTPRKTFDRNGKPCREFVTEAVVGGSAQRVYGTACRQDDGAWKIVRTHY